MKTFAIIAFLFTGVISFAQTKFIEVEVTDTISLKPHSFQVTIYPLEVQYFNDAGEYDTIPTQKKIKNKLKQVRRTLESKKYKLNPFNFSDLYPSLVTRKKIDDEGFSVNVTGLTELKKLEEILMAIEDVETHVKVTKFADEQIAEDLLTKKLIDKAKARSVVIGNASGLKPGKIIEVKEGTTIGVMTSVRDLYTRISAGNSFGQNGNNYTGSMSKTFVEKFAAE